MFNDFLMHHNDFLPKVGNHWQNQDGNGTTMFTFSKKLKSLKGTIKELNRDNYSDFEKRVKEAHSHLIDCLNRLLGLPSLHLANLEKEAHKNGLF